MPLVMVLEVDELTMYLVELSLTVALYQSQIGMSYIHCAVNMNKLMIDNDLALFIIEKQHFDFKRSFIM